MMMYKTKNGRHAHRDKRTHTHVFYTYIYIPVYDTYVSKKKRVDFNVAQLLEKINLPVLGLPALLRSPSPVSWAADGHLPTELGGTSMGKKGNFNLTTN